MFATNFLLLPTLCTLFAIPIRTAPAAEDDSALRIIAIPDVTDIIPTEKPNVDEHITTDYTAPDVDERFPKDVTEDGEPEPVEGSYLTPEMNLLEELLGEVKESRQETAVSMQDQSRELKLLTKVIEQASESLSKGMISQVQKNRTGKKLAQGRCDSQDNQKKCTKSVTFGTEFPSPKWFSPENVLVDSCDDVRTINVEGSVTWWAAPNGATGQDAFFTLDLGCTKCISQVVARNSGNGQYQNRGTKEFLVSVSTESNPSYWRPVVKGYLEDVRNVACRSQVGKQTFGFEPTEARYVKFEVISYHGHHGAVLQFFDVL